MAATIPASHMRYCGPGSKFQFYLFSYKFIIYAIID